MNGREATVSCSIGIAMYPEHGAMSDPDRPRRGGDARGQDGGGGGYAFFEPRMMSGAREQLELLHDLRSALAERRARARLPAQDPRAERRDHRRRGADALAAIRSAA